MSRRGEVGKCLILIVEAQGQTSNSADIVKRRGWEHIADFLLPDTSLHSPLGKRCVMYIALQLKVQVERGVMCEKA
jgi:hypothetical protein